MHLRVPPRYIPVLRHGNISRCRTLATTNASPRRKFLSSRRRDHWQGYSPRFALKTEDILRGMPEMVPEKSLPIALGTDDALEGMLGGASEKPEPISLKIDDILAETRLAMQRKMLQTVTTTGVDLDSVYRQTLQQIKEQKGDGPRLGMEALMWVSHAKRPLQINELCHALAVDVEATDLDPQKIRLQDTVLGSCLGLVMVDKKTSIVRLIHNTLQEYLSRPGILPNVHKILGETCLAYLNYDQVKRLPANNVGDLRHMPFLEYSSLHWAAHAKIELSDRAKALALELLSQFENHISFVLSFKTMFEFDGPYSCGRFTSLHYASCLGVDELVAALIEIKSCDINQQDGWLFTPLIWAVYHRNHGAVRLLLTCKGIDIEKQDITGQTALWVATDYEDVEMVRLLTNGGADPNKASHNGQTPLMMASGHRNMQILALLQPQAITMSDLD